MDPEFSDISIGILVALPVECAAVLEMLDDHDRTRVPDDPGIYYTGSLPSSDPGRPHRTVVALQARDGTRTAATATTQLVRSFPAVRSVVMPGISAAVPKVWSVPVRLGDVVVATDGAVDYGHLRVEDDRSTVRRHLEGVSADLLRADRRLQVEDPDAPQSWRDILASGRVSARFARPGHSDEVPHVHRGAIGSGDRLLRSATERDRIATEHGVVAFEMECAGMATAAHLAGRQWFMVRGVADFGDAAKNQLWHAYASATAAAYLRGLLAECSPPAPAARALPPMRLDELDAVVTALLELPEMRDDNGRHTILNALPPHIRVTIPHHAVGRLHVLDAVQTCLRFPDGAGALLRALRLAVGGTPEFARVEASLRPRAMP